MVHQQSIPAGRNGVRSVLPVLPHGQVHRNGIHAGNGRLFCTTGFASLTFIPMPRATIGAVSALDPGDNFLSQQISGPAQECYSMANNPSSHMGRRRYPCSNLASELQHCEQILVSTTFRHTSRYAVSYNAPSLLTENLEFPTVLGFPFPLPSLPVPERLILREGREA